MRHLLRLGLPVITLAAAVGLAAPVEAGRPARQPVRFATFNASLNRNAPGVLRADLERALDDDPANDSAQLQAVLDIVAANDPDVLLINEFDTGTDGDAATVALFAELAEYPYFFTGTSNTGIPSGYDLNNNGVVGGGDDALGFGAFPGQFGMAVFSKFPIDAARARTFQRFLWKDMPGALLPVDPATGQSWYSPEELAILPLSSKSHWDVPIETPRGVVHFLVSHPTPPVFDGAEDRNGRRNYDEIGFWADYLRPGRQSRYIYDDAGRTGGLRPNAEFVIAGDQNSDPLDGDSIPGAIQQLLEHPRIREREAPSSAGAAEAAALQGGANTTHRSDPRFDTADFADTAPGNLRADYVLPSARLRVTDRGVFWPALGQPGSELTGTFPFPSSDHRLVWIDVRG